MTERELDQYRCTECETKVWKRLVHLEYDHPTTGEPMEGPFERLACDCTVFERSGGKYIRFCADIPNQWKPTSKIGNGGDEQ